MPSLFTLYTSEQFHFLMCIAIYFNGYILAFSLHTTAITKQSDKNVVLTGPFSIVSLLFPRLPKNISVRALLSPHRPPRTHPWESRKSNRHK